MTIAAGRVDRPYAGKVAGALVTRSLRIYHAQIMRERSSRVSSPRRPTNLSLDPDLVQDARTLGVNLSQAAEAGLRQAVARAKAEQWKLENAEAIASSNAYVEANGLPLAKYRQF